MQHAGDHLDNGGKGSWRSGSYWVDLSSNTLMSDEQVDEVERTFNIDNRITLSDATPDFDGYVLASRNNVYCTQCDETEETIFDDMITQTENIEKYIIENHNGHIKAAYGCSLGGSFVGLLVERQNIHIDHAVLGS